MEGIIVIIFVVMVWGFVYLFASWASGMRIKNKWGQTISSPDDLPNLISDARKMVDNKYKLKKELEKEFNEEMRYCVGPIQERINSLSFKLALDEATSINPKLSKEELIKLKQLIQTLVGQKEQIIDEITQKYERKIAAL